MKPLAARMLCLLLCSVLTACASAPTPPPKPAWQLLHDERFAAVAPVLQAGEVFALSDNMKHYAATQLATVASRHDPRRALIDALYRPDQLRLSYDAGATRSAAQAFDARAGNCLSLVIMTAAFAKHMGLPVQYQTVLVEDTVNRSGDLVMLSGHVNLVMGRLPSVVRGGELEASLTIDFLPQQDLRGQRVQSISEATVVAMFMNNRAAEALADGRLDESYGWARQAVLHDPGFLASHNTLGVVYLRSGLLKEAEEVLRYVLARDGRSTTALSNLVRVLEVAGRLEEAHPLALRLAELQPYPPFHFLDLGRAALQAGDAATAQRLFARELRRQPDHHEVHFWMAQAFARLGDGAAASLHLRLALHNSTTRQARDLYGAKLDRLRAGLVQ
jgi:Tfp pilus assembly protein PilF